MFSTVRTAPVRIARQNVRAASSAIATKYANAAYSAALSKSPATLDTVQRELTSISNALRADEKLAGFVANPTLSTKDRQNGLEALFSKAGGAKTSDITRNLLSLMAENRRLAETSEVVTGFTELVAKYKGELEVTVTSAKPLDKDVLGRIEKALRQSQIAQQSKTVKVTNKARFRHSLVALHCSDAIAHKFHVCLPRIHYAMAGKRVANWWALGGLRRQVH